MNIVKTDVPSWIAMFSTLGCISLLALGQSGAEPALTVVEKHLTTLNGSNYFVLTIRNEAQKPVVGFVSRCILQDASGKEVGVVQMGGVTMDPNVERHDPGSTWKIQVAAIAEDHPEIAIKDVRTEFDYVLFRDLSSSGPDAGKRGILMRREYEGSQMQLARLRRVLRTQGKEAVLEILAREEPRFARFEGR